MDDVVTIPSIGFSRGVVVRRRDGTPRGVAPNMIVVRGLGETTACVLCEGDEAGTLRLREFKTSELVQVMSNT